MLDVNPYSIRSYSQCPRRAYFEGSTQSPGHSEDDLLIERVIQSAYLHHAASGSPPKFRAISSDATRHLSRIYRTPELLNRVHTESVLSILNRWYGKYLDICDPGIINVPIKLNLDNQCVYTDTVPIVSTGSKLRLIDFYHTDKPTGSYYRRKILNDYVAKSRTWGYWQFTNTLPDEYIRFVHGPNSVTIVSVPIREWDMIRFSKYIKQILRGWKDGSFYCSFSEQCNNCPYKLTCEL